MPDQPLRSAAAAASGIPNVQVMRNLAGKPIVADANGQPIPYHVSNSHDGGTHLALAIPEEGLAGVGVDLVFLPRLESSRHTIGYLHRLAGRVMGNEELTEFVHMCNGLDEREVRLQFAARFSLMEAASKALGTGLRLGVGFGRPTSIHPHDLAAFKQHAGWNIRPGTEARTCMERLGGREFKCYCGVSELFLASCVLLVK